MHCDRNVPASAVQGPAQLPSRESDQAMLRRTREKYQMVKNGQSSANVVVVENKRASGEPAVPVPCIKIESDDSEDTWANSDYSAETELVFDTEPPVKTEPIEDLTDTSGKCLAIE